MLDEFFIYGAIPANAEKGAYIPLLVLASYAVASLGSYAGLTLAVQLFGARTKQQRWVLHSIGAIALGGGIWSMHFIGMLAYETQMRIDYDAGLTLLSLLIAIMVAWFVLHIARLAKLSARAIAIGAVLLGIGICAMHYTGMAAMQMPMHLLYVPSLFFLSVVIAITASGSALWIVFTLGRHSGRWQIVWRVIAALVMGAAVCGMHYTGMAAAVFVPCADCYINAGHGIELLGAAVTVSIVILLGILAFTFTVSRRLFLIAGCGFLFALPLVVIVYQATTVLNLDIHVTVKEQYGVKYHSALIDLLQRVQEVRGLAYVVRSGDTTFADRLQSKKEETRHIIAIVDDADRSYGQVLAVDQGWQDVKNNILLSLKKENSQPIGEFKQYSNAIQSLTGFMEDVADNSNLSTDSQLDSDYLADAAVHVTPGIMETLGKMRGLIAGLLASQISPPQWTSAQTLELQALYNELGVEDDDMKDVLERALHANKTTGRFKEYHDQAIEPVLEKLKNHLEQMIFAHTNDLTTTEVFTQISATIALYGTLYDKTSNAFLDLLKQRQKEYTIKRDLVLYSSMAAFFGFTMLFIFLYRVLTKTERAERDAAVANATKSEFLANMSHELRTPLNSILGMNRLLLESALTEEQQGLADTVFRSSVNLLEIVNDILDLSKIEAGELRLEHIGFDPQYVFHGVVHALDHIAREKRVPIVRHYEKEELPYLLGDPTRLGRVLVNLIGNAIKYTDKGQVEVRAFCKKLDVKHVEFRCEITDTGIGIPKEKQESIFEKFVQADTSTTRKYGGTGLGLAITKQLVELMGGKVGVSSEVGVGSTFWFEVPFEVTDKLHEDKHIRRQKALLGTIPPEKARILAAEDHPMNQLLIRKLLQKFGIGHFKIVENGLDVLKSFKENEWDVILMDCHMPDKNGYETTSDIRSLERKTNTHVPIIAMTANAMLGDKEKCLRYGMDEYVSKPVNVDELKEILGQWIHFDNSAVSDQAPAVDPENQAPLDLTQLRTFTDGDAVAEKELIGIFVKQSDENLRVLKENCIDGTCKAWVEAAHMFKGAAAGVGAGKLSQLCGQAQHLPDAKAIERLALVRLIESEYARTKNHLKTMGLLT